MCKVLGVHINNVKYNCVLKGTWSKIKDIHTYTYTLGVKNTTESGRR